MAPIGDLQGAGDGAPPAGALTKATSVQPSNPQTWARLGCYDLRNGRAAVAWGELLRAGALSPAIDSAVRTNDATFCASIDG